MEVGGLVGDPRQKARDIGMRAQHRGLGIVAGQLRVGQGRMDGAMADRMDRRGHAPAFGFGDQMVPLHLCAQRPLAQRARRGRRGAGGQGLGGGQPRLALHASGHGPDIGTPAPRPNAKGADLPAADPPPRVSVVTRCRVRHALRSRHFETQAQARIAGQAAQADVLRADFGADAVHGRVIVTLQVALHARCEVVEVVPAVADLAVEQAAVAGAEAEAAIRAILPVDVTRHALGNRALGADEHGAQRHVEADDAFDQRAVQVIALGLRGDAGDGLTIELLPAAHHGDIGLDTESARAVRSLGSGVGLRVNGGRRSRVGRRGGRHVLREGGDGKRRCRNGGREGELTHDVNTFIASTRAAGTVSARCPGPSKHGDYGFVAARDGFYRIGRET
ncbi:hypothetical protein WR25_19414 [Diploscapter pachys]|uniref:Uncharacterized protein n=1 Tax=Diploscapter pachys TaxID=2018661 RepID=A0A2A2M2A7_9BILA|nr:hypothetical protein WR25_19414 [Diploscapter pachys]